MSRWLVVALVAITAVPLAHVQAPTAKAEITNIIAFTGDSDLADVVPYWAGLQAYVTSPTGGFFCAAPVGSTSCSWGKGLVPPFYAGFVPVKSGSLPTGNWHLVALDGEMNLTAVSQDFVVIGPAPGETPIVPNDDGTKGAIVQGLFDSMSRICTGLSAASALNKFDDTYREVRIVMAGSPLSPGGATMAAVVVGAGAAAADWASVQPGYSLPGLSGRLGKQLWLFCTAMFGYSIAPFTPGTPGAAGVLAGWLNDPPDPAYDELVIPDYIPPTLFSPDNEHAGYALELDRMRALFAATLTTYERYQGAEADGEDAARADQAAYLWDLTVELTASMEVVADGLEATASQIQAAVPDPADRSYTADDIAEATAHFDDIRADGLSAIDIAALTALGYDENFITWLESELGLVDPALLVPGETMDSQMVATAASLREAIPVFEDFGIEMNLVAAQLDADVNEPPTAAFTTVPSAGEPPLDVQFDGTASSDPDGDTLTYEWDFGDATAQSTSPTPSHTYVLPGTYTATLTVSDGEFTHAVTHDIEVSVNTPPVALNDFAETRIDTDVQIFPLANDYDPDFFAPAPTISGSDTVSAEGGSVTCDSACLYTPPAGFLGSDSFDYTIVDSRGATDTGTVTITVLPANLPPTVADFSRVTTLGTPIDLEILWTDPDDGDTPELTSWTQPEHGSVDCEGDTCTYQPDPGFAGGDSFTVTVTDDGGLTGDGLIGVFVLDTSPVAVDDVLAVPVGATRSINVLDNDRNDDVGDPAHVATFTQPAHGSVDCEADGVCEYTAPPGFNGYDPFTYQLGDAAGNGTVGAVHVLVREPQVGSGVNAGRDFWLAFPRNIYPVEQTPLRLAITSEFDTSGTVTIDGLGFSAPFTVAAGDLVSVDIPYQALLMPDVVEDKAIHVTAAADITVYGFNYPVYSTDAYLGLPLRALGSDYMVAAHSAGGTGAQASIVGTVDGTTVVVTGIPIFSGGVDNTHVLELDQGQTFMFERGIDLSGMQIRATDPIAVLGGHTCDQVPDNQTYWCNHLVEMLPPVSAWGRSAIVVPLATRTSDLVRVMAARDNTTVLRNGTEVAVLDAGEIYEHQLATAARYSADKPILVTQFSNGGTFDNVENADPFMIVIPSSEQFKPAYTVTTAPDNFPANFLNIIIPTAAADTLTIDGVPVDADAFTPLAGTSYATAQLPVELGAHRVVGGASFGIVVYGFAVDDGYGYTGGAGLASIATLATVEVTPPTATLAVGAEHCVDATARDADGLELPDIEIEFAVTGANTASGVGATDAQGVATFCWTGAAEGVDIVTATSGLISGQATASWQTVGGNTAPAIADQLDATINELTPYTRTITALDADSDVPVFSLVTGPTGLTVGAGGALAWTPTELQGPGVYPVTVRAVDGRDAALVDEATFTITVNEVNTSPTLDAIGDIEVVPGQAATGTAAGHDTDLPAQVLVYTAPTAPTGFTINPATGAFSFTTSTPGAYPITIRVSDGAASAERSFTITVEAIDRPPMLGDIADVTVDEGTTVTRTANANDPDGDPIVYSLSGCPSGSSINATSGAFSWATGETDGPGSYPCTVVATANGQADEDSFTITVNEVNRNPELEAIADRTVNPGEAVTLTASASDPDRPANTLAFSLVAGSPGSINATSGAFTWTPAVADLGDHTVTVRVTDGAGGSAQRSFVVHVVREPTALDLGGDTTGQYSDSARLTATLTSDGAPLAGRTITFTFGAATATDTTNSSGVAQATFPITTGAGSVAVEAAFAVTSVYQAATDTGSFTVTQENSTIAYDGDVIGLTSAPVRLAAVFTDSAATGYGGPGAEAAGTIGDITRARIRFDIYAAGSCLTGSPVAQVAANVTDTAPTGDGIGRATATWTANEGSYCAVPVLVGPSSATNAFYTAQPSQPAGFAVYTDTTGKITGGGWVTLADGGKGRFGFNAQNNGKATKGQFVYTSVTNYRGTKAMLVVKSNAIDGLRVTGTTFPIQAILSGKASYRYIAMGSGATLYETGNATFAATVVDSNAKTGDAFGITVTDKNGSVVLELGPAALGAGNIVAHLNK